MMRLLIVCAVVTLLVAGCGSSSPSATESPSAPEPCAANDLGAAIVHNGVAAGTAYYTIGLSNVSATGCELRGPPAIEFLDAAQNVVDTSVRYGGDCGTPPVDPETCVDSSFVEMPAAQATPSSVATSQVTLTLAIANAANFDPQPTPLLDASSIRLTFTNARGANTIPLAQPVTLIPSGQVTLTGYGSTTPATPSATP